LLKANQLEILRHLGTLLKGAAPDIAVNHITAKEFMSALRIGRRKFVQLAKSK
jgi:hypothetical protein